MQVSIFQGPGQTDSVEQNLDILSTQAKSAAAKGSDLLIFPEMYLTGYNIGPEKTRQLAELSSGNSAQRASDIARENDIALIYGFPELYQDEVYNSAIMIDRNGLTLTVYRKTHLFGEIDKCAFAAGDSPAGLIEYNGVKMGILICYDVEFVENVRHLALAGADFIAVPTALMVPYEFVPTKLIPARAFENQVFLAYANRCDQENELDYYGLSCICAADGADLARAGTSQELITATLDFNELEKSRTLNTHITDRRPELYDSLVKSSS